MKKKFLITLVFLSGAFFGCVKTETPKPKTATPTKVFTFIGSEKECNDELVNHKNGVSQIYPLTNSSGQVINYVLVVTEKIDENELK